MIRTLQNSDIMYYNNLGLLLNSNFSKLYELNNLLKYNNNKLFGYDYQGKIVGFIHISLSFDEADLVNIAVFSDFRRKNIGTKLIDYVIKKYDIKKINIEVNENNKQAIEFYKNYGFKLVRKIKNYYGNNDALFMVKEII